MARLYVGAMIARFSERCLAYRPLLLSRTQGSPARAYVGVNVEDLVSKALAETDGE